MQSKYVETRRAKLRVVKWMSTLRRMSTTGILGAITLVTPLTAVSVARGDDSVAVGVTNVP